MFTPRYLKHLFEQAGLEDLGQRPRPAADGQVPAELLRQIADQLQPQ